MDGESPRDQAAAARAVGWMIWQRPGRGRITLETGLPLIAGAPEALWSLCAQWDEIDRLLGASLDDSHRDRSSPAGARRRSKAWSSGGDQVEGPADDRLLRRFMREPP